MSNKKQTEIQCNISDNLLNTLLEYVNHRGFPYYQYTIIEKLIQMDKLFKYDFDSVINDEKRLVKQTMHGLGLCWSYFPNSWSIKVRKHKTPMDIYNDKDMLKLAIKKRLKRGGLSMLVNENSMTDSQIRKALRTYSGVQSVSNFRPSASASIYRKFANDGVVWDMSCGFGGRLLGAMLSDKVKKYIGTEPNTETFNGLKLMSVELNTKNINIELHCKGSEDFIPSEPIDLCFTSPPYFNTEQYCIEDTQSFIKYDTIESWNNLFLRKTINNCFRCLKPNGYMIINIANVVTHKNLEQDTTQIAIEEGFILEDIYSMQLSSITKGGFKHEPIFIFKKYEQ